MVLFAWQNIALMIAGLVNLAMGIFVLKRGWRSKINLYFASLVFFNFLWSFFMIGAFSTNNLSLVNFFDKTTNLFGVGIMLSLFYFTLYFPYQTDKISSLKTKLIWFFSIVISLMIYTKWFVINTIWIEKPFNYISYYNKYGYFIYAVYFFVLACWSIYFLFKKYRQAEGVAKLQLKRLILSITVGLICGAYFNLLLNYFGVFTLGWFGPVFTLFMNIVVFRAIRSPKEKING